MDSPLVSGDGTTRSALIGGPIHPLLPREDIVLPLSEKNVSAVPNGGTT
jgi:hypothetical protein